MLELGTYIYTDYIQANPINAIGIKILNEMSNWSNLITCNSHNLYMQKKIVQPDCKSHTYKHIHE